MIFHDEEGVHMSEADYAELVKREIGPCGKHRKADWVYENCCDEGVTPPNSKIGNEPAHADYNSEGICDFLCNSYCRICREIEQAVAGAYEAAALCANDPLGRHHDSYIAKAIRSLDSSAASRGKMAIQEEALRALIQAVDEGEKAWQEGNCHEEGCGCITEHIKRAILSLIDKSGGRR